MQKRIISLDFLRGFCALSVAIAHFGMANSYFIHSGEVIASTAVEIFFILSGFVLAPQILLCLKSNFYENFKIFLIRRWMRTIPPFMISLTIISLYTGNLFNEAFLKYMFFVKSFFSISNNDYFPIAWSLAVEEWFYIIFIPIVFFLKKMSFSFFKIIFFYVLLFFIVKLVFFYFSNDDLRRITFFRLDSIAFGFLLFLVINKVSGTTINLFHNNFKIILLIFSFLIVVSSKMVISNPKPIWLLFYIYFTSCFGMLIVFILVRKNHLFESFKILKLFSFYSGALSYSLYLFHPIILIVVDQYEFKYTSIKFLLYILGTVFLAGMVRYFYEIEILRSRPNYQQKNFIEINKKVFEKL